ncbi:hypothetical protein HMPREF9389_0019 [Streptococcus sanguinis SK355]|uniref:Uncharacterized protein n=1 Tax=Streptococcus sanguinis SK355 TaxID=888816 RepID=F3UMG1_STRSA|nr:hypothetical protein HMPREF9389_0019 [Streptococcus sanguinis SK355]
MFLLQIYLIVEFKIPYYSITNLKNSQTYFLKFKKAFVQFSPSKSSKFVEACALKLFQTISKIVQIFHFSKT